MDVTYNTDIFFSGRLYPDFRSLLFLHANRESEMKEREAGKQRSKGE
jgi:undecaprenyl pyrophosphate synthase